jgi:ribosomal protein S18 acetylase RimI-like enzyme
VVESSSIHATPEVRVLGEDHAPEVTRVLCGSFYDYPVMRYVVGDSADYDHRLNKFVHFFVMAHALRGDPLLGTMDGTALTATAIISYTDGRESPAELAALRDAMWGDLGPESRSRYGVFAAACVPFEVDTPHIHLSMIGVSRAAQGRGLGRILIDQVHLISERDATSQGVTLTTEDPSNVPLYEHFGYRVVGHTRVSPSLETWGFFRPD